MSTVIRTELSKKNKYYISKHRYLELKHFCLQYDEWKKEYNSIIDIPSITYGEKIKPHCISDHTANIAIKRSELRDNMILIEKISRETDSEIAKYIFIAVTKDVSFVALKTIYDIPCGKDMYYDRYRKFFWLLDKKR